MPAGKVLDVNEMQIIDFSTSAITATYHCFIWRIADRSRVSLACSTLNSYQGRIICWDGTSFKECLGPSVTRYNYSTVELDTSYTYAIYTSLSTGENSFTILWP